MNTSGSLCDETQTDQLNRFFRILRKTSSQQGNQHLDLHDESFPAEEPQKHPRHWLIQQRAQRMQLPKLL
eukprot:CCRYP_006091-RA/>CCRYP_006091-RA protein AED:0.00 eAED:0.00 QI:163/1/1/1/0/0/2/0/69